MQFRTQIWPPVRMSLPRPIQGQKSNSLRESKSRRDFTVMLSWNSVLTDKHWFRKTKVLYCHCEENCPFVNGSAFEVVEYVPFGRDTGTCASFRRPTRIQTRWLAPSPPKWKATLSSTDLLTALSLGTWLILSFPHRYIDWLKNNTLLLDTTQTHIRVTQPALLPLMVLIWFWIWHVVCS